MNEIIRHIQYLLLSNDCVTIPGFGAVLSHTKPAEVNEANGELSAPSRIFSFNPSLKHNDGLLVSSIARAKETSFESAKVYVDSKVAEIKRVLQSSGRLNLGSVGSVSLTSDGTMSFQTALDNKLAPSYFLLPAINLVSVNQQLKNRNYRDSRRQSTYWRNAVRVAASLALLIALGIMFSTPIDIDNAQYASVGFENFKPSADKTVTKPLTLSSSAPLVLVINNHADASEIADTAAHNQYVRLRNQNQTTVISPETKHSDSNFRFDNNDKYCVIVASLATQNEANDYIAKSDNKNLGILNKDGRYRIFAATAETTQQAQIVVSQLSESYPGAWVCRK